MQMGRMSGTPTINGFPLVVRVRDDYRVRLPGEAVIVGDQFVRGEGDPVEVVAARQVGTREYLVAVPVEVMKLLNRPTERLGKDWCSRTDDPADLRNVLEPDGLKKRLADAGLYHLVVPDPDVPADGVGRFEVELPAGYEPRPMAVAKAD
jgi:hypothetical protein